MRTIMVILYVGKIRFVIKEIDVMKGEHMTPEYIKMYPSAETPVLIDGQKHIYGGGSMTVVKHLCNRFDKCAKRYCIMDYRTEMDTMFQWISKNIKPITAKIQKLVMMNMLCNEMENHKIR